jgi:hypothetical protein
MTSTALINALLYELAKWLIERRPALAFSPLMIRLLAWCRPDWEQWKTEQIMKSVDSQAAALVEQWEKEEDKVKLEQSLEKAKEQFPNATVAIVPDAPVPSVMIIHEADENASDAVKALGGEMRIASSFSLEDQ